MTLRTTLIAAALAFAVPALARPHSQGPWSANPRPISRVTDATARRRSLSALQGQDRRARMEQSGMPVRRQALRQRRTCRSSKPPRASDGVVWLTINSGAAGKQGDLDAAGANAYVAQSRRQGRRRTCSTATARSATLYDAKTTPHMYVIDKDGVLRYMGGIDSIASTDKDDIAKATQYVRAGARRDQGRQSGQRADVAALRLLVKYGS